ncbi:MULTISPECIES: hypothetical protein [Acinetobacter]|uniref:hypothetical protein n=1 Tax=Acinetobacter TaxID=469 RepID=UPI00148EA16D|nr:hypothetical protein [Acinetobacter pullicarnis]
MVKLIQIISISIGIVFSGFSYADGGLIFLEKNIKENQEMIKNKSTNCTCK